MVTAETTGWLRARLEAERRSGEIAIVFFVGVIAYFVFISQYLMHDHGPRLPWVPTNDQVSAGRWFNYFLSQINYSADIPVLLPLLGIVMAVFTAQLSLRIWNLQLDYLGRIVTAAAIVTFPFTLAFFYYTFQTPLFFVSWVFAASAAWFSRRNSWRAIAVACLLVLLTLASYQASISVYAVLVMTAAIADLCRQRDEVNPPVRPILWRLAAAGLALMIGLVLYYASLKLLGISAPEKMSITNLAELPDRVRSMAGAAFMHLWWTQPELLRGQKVLLLTLLIGGVSLSLYDLRHAPSRLGFALLLWLGAILATKLIFLLVNTGGGAVQYRYTTALGFLHAFTMGYVLARLSGARPALRYVALALVAVVMVRFVQADLVRQAVLLRGQQHDLAIANRILDRIETLPELDSTRAYDLVRIGRYSNYRVDLLKYPGKAAKKDGDNHMDYGEITDAWADEAVFKMLGASVHFMHGFDADHAEKAAYAREHLLKDRKPWPDRSSVFIDGQTIYVYMR